MIPRLQLTGLCAAALMLAAVPAALAQAPYPSQQIKIICPFPAGGGTDLTSRLLFIRGESAKFAKIIAEAGIKLEQ